MSETGSLFVAAAKRDGRQQPLAERMRPASLDEVVGQEKILGKGRALRMLVERGELPSLILWGPPGTGKTTLAQILARSVAADLVILSAVQSGIKEIREVVAAAQERRGMFGKRTVMFVDEIHRFNKAQQDALLPHVEAGTVTLIGATTENPSFEVNAALLSRSRVFVLEALDDASLRSLLERALADRSRGLAGLGVSAPDAVLEQISQLASGDARRALTTLEVAVSIAAAHGARILEPQHVEEAAQAKTLLYDKAGEQHYNVISAFIKSMRGSDPDASLYWLARLLEAGEEPRFVLRRMIIFASEDVGNADPRGLGIAIDALQAFEMVGMPEGFIPMAQAVTYLASAPKSNRSYKGYLAARQAVHDHGALPVPMHLRNAPTKLMKGLGYGAGYQYPHDDPAAAVAQSYLPDELRGTRFYEPAESGYEKSIGERLRLIEAQRGGRAGAGGKSGAAGAKDDAAGAKDDAAGAKDDAAGAKDDAAGAKDDAAGAKDDGS